MKYCLNPECPHFRSCGSPPEYRNEIIVCADCGMELVQSDSPLSQAKDEHKPNQSRRRESRQMLFMEHEEAFEVSSPLVTIGSYREGHLAHLAKSKLEFEGIPAFIGNENVINLNWFYSNAVGGVTLQVPEVYAHQALDVLNSTSSDDPEEKPLTWEEAEVDEAVDEERKEELSFPSISHFLLSYKLVGEGMTLILCNCLSRIA